MYLREYSIYKYIYNYIHIENVMLEKLQTSKKFSILKYFLNFVFMEYYFCLLLYIVFYIYNTHIVCKQYLRY